MKVDVQKEFVLRLSSREAEILCCMAGAAFAKSKDASDFVIELFARLDSHLPDRVDSFSDHFEEQPT